MLSGERINYQEPWKSPAHAAVKYNDTFILCLTDFMPWYFTISNFSIKITTQKKKKKL